MCISCLKLDLQRFDSTRTARLNASFVRGVGLEKGKQACAMISLSRMDAAGCIRWASSG